MVFNEDTETWPVGSTSKKNRLIAEAVFRRNNIVNVLFYFFYDCGKSLWVVHRQIGQNLTVKLDSAVF